MKVKNNTLFVEPGDLEYEWNDQEFKYLTVKTNVLTKKLQDKYPDIVILNKENDPGNMRVGFQQWGPESKILLVLGNKDQPSFWINNVAFKTNVTNNGQVGPGNLNKEFDEYCKIIDKLIMDYAN